ncbi:MAG: hypothetical protein RBT61_13320, partial [Candidatus Kapabacteria bacterium]|nr:hypothetical protein [Candidatus Kapabacteria bacterium]
MRKIILICLSLIAFTSVSLHSQWIEKEGYWELSEKVPDLRDLKILPEENLIITVSKDNTIRHIEYDSGKILKSGKPSDITEDNDHAKISSDGKTTVVARYKEGKNFTDINISVLNNSNYMIIAEDNFQNGIKYDKSQVREVTEMKINHLDYGYLTNALILANYIKTQGSENGGQYKTWGQKGNIYFAKTVGNNFNLIKHFENDAPLAIKRISNKSDGNYISILYDHFKYENARRTSIEENNSLVIFDSNFDTTQLFKSKYSYLRTDSYPDGAWSLTETGYLFPMYQLFETENPNLLKIRSNGKLFTFDIDKGELIDSLENHIYKKDIISFNQARLIGQIDNKNFNIYNAVNTKLISTTTLPQKVTIANPMINEKNNRTFFVLESGEVVFYKLDVLEQFPKEIITLSKDVAYVGETIEFTSLDNSINADYKWEIDNEVIMITKDRNFHYKFDKAGVYDIKLTITLPNSSTHEFTKLKAIRVNDSLKA